MNLLSEPWPAAITRDPDREIRTHKVPWLTRTVNFRQFELASGKPPPAQPAPQQPCAALNLRPLARTKHSTGSWFFQDSFLLHVKSYSRRILNARSVNRLVCVTLSWATTLHDPSLRELTEKGEWEKADWQDVTSPGSASISLNSPYLSHSWPRVYA